MDNLNTEQPSIEPVVTIVEVNRVLELGKLLSSVLTQQELEEIRNVLSGTRPLDLMFSDEAKEES